jgi:hypothetical protein
MLVLRFNLPRNRRGEEFGDLIKNLVNHIDSDLGFEEVKVMVDRDTVEITTKPDSHSGKVEDDLISVELMVSRNMVINNSTIGEDESYQAIKSELKRFIKE